MKREVRQSKLNHDQQLRLLKAELKKCQYEIITHKIITDSLPDTQFGVKNNRNKMKILKFETADIAQLFKKIWEEE